MQFCTIHHQAIEVISRKLLITLIHHDVISKMDYCNSLFLALPKSQLARLQRILNRAARIIFSVPARESVSQLIKDKLHWLPIGARIDFKILLLIQKCLLYKFPEYLCAHLIPSPTRNNRLKHFRFRGPIKKAKRAFHFSAPIIYSKLPDALQEMEIPSFKANLKTFLYLEAFEKKLDSSLFNETSQAQKNLFNKKKKKPRTSK